MIRSLLRRLGMAGFSAELDDAARRMQILQLLENPEEVDWAAVRALVPSTSKPVTLAADEKVAFLCIGAQKSGTTWLHRQLLRHPEVCLSPFKENHYFDFLYAEGNTGWIPKHFRSRVVKNLRDLMATSGEVDWFSADYFAQVAEAVVADKIDEGWYHKLYALCREPQRLRGDITPAYLPLPREGVDAVYRYNPEMKIIALLREPVDRALSRARMVFTQRGIEVPTDNDWRKVIAGFGVVRQSSYFEQISNWLTVFPARQVLITPYERIEGDLAGLVRDVCEFLGVGQLEPQELLDERIHPGRQYDIPAWVIPALEEELAADRDACMVLLPQLKSWWFPHA